MGGRKIQHQVVDVVWTAAEGVLSASETGEL